jgi:hypothetical protein
MPVQAMRDRDRCRDVNGTPIALFCQVEQVADGSEPMMLPSWLHQQAQVVGRGLGWVYVRFPGNQVISLQSQLLRVLDDASGGE